LTALQSGLLSLIVGFMIGFAVKRWLISRKSYDGTILVSHEDQKTLYSLELDDYPEKIALQKEVVFKVDTTPETLNRD
jgi:hypothetical protein